VCVCIVCVVHAYVYVCVVRVCVSSVCVCTCSVCASVVLHACVFLCEWESNYSPCETLLFVRSCLHLYAYDLT